MDTKTQWPLPNAWLWIVLEEAKEYFMFQRKIKLGNLQARLQATTTIQVNWSPSKEILNQQPHMVMIHMKIF